MGGSARLTKNSPAVRLLRSKFESGELKGNELPKNVWDSDIVFKRHKLPNFRTCYNSMRQEFGLKGNTEPQYESDAVALDIRCRAEENNATRKRRFSALTDAELGDSDEEKADHGAGAELTSGDLSFKPLYMISDWVEHATLARRLSVAIILPSGITSGHFSINVVDGGQYLQLSVQWPKPLIDVLVMHRWKLSDPSSGFMPYHYSVLGFERTLKEHRARSSDAIESVARIPLPFAVQTQILSKQNLLFREGDGTKMLYVQLKAFVLEEYAVVADTQAFKAG